uniref:DUF3741 domain-containing protein n=1 Tax=Oryza meridionalis TaxID=40149 RepID=A0A0E0D8Z9_9ORYZ
MNTGTANNTHSLLPSSPPDSTRIFPSPRRLAILTRPPPPAPISLRRAAAASSSAAALSTLISKMEQISLEHRYKECRPRRNNSCPTKTLVGKDQLKELEHRRPSPSVIAKLMGLDVLPPAYVAHNRHQEFKDVFEVSEEPQEAVTKERSHNFPKGLPSLKRSALKLRKLMPSKSPYGDETFDNNVVNQDGFDRLNLLEINNPLFEKHPYDVNCSPNYRYEKDSTSSTFRKYPVGLGNSSLKEIVVLELGLGEVQHSGNAFSTPEPSDVNKNFRRKMKQAEFSATNRGSQNLLGTKDINNKRRKTLD